MPVLFIDAESRSRLDLKKVGAYVYVKDPSTKVLLWSVRSPDWAKALVFETYDLLEVLLHLREVGKIQWSKSDPLLLVHWGAFDRLIAQEQGWSFSWRAGSATHSGQPSVLQFEEGVVRWGDLREVSLTYGCPAALENAAKFFGGAQKLAGHQLIKFFCKPNKKGEWNEPGHHPKKWQEFRAYAAQDTEALVPIFDKLSTMGGAHSMAEHFKFARMTERMNERGAPIDVLSVKRSIKKLAGLEGGLISECQAVHGINPTQTEKVRVILGTPNLQKETLELIAKEDGDTNERLAWIRLTTAGAARKKLQAMIERGSRTDHRVRGQFSYHGAWTRRWTSTGVQLQNMVREPSDEEFFEGLGKLKHSYGLFREVRNNIRGYICAPPGKTFVAGDYNAIELRVAAWFADEAELVKDLAEGVDVYIKAAARVFGVEPGSISKGDIRRQIGKTLILAAQFGQGGRGYQMRLAQDGIEVELDEATLSIKQWRANHLKILSRWDDCQEAFEELIDAPSGTIREVGIARFERWPDFIKVVRPSGFAQYYWSPCVRVGHWPDGGERLDLCYIGRSAKTARMIWKKTYGADIFQGIVQGIAADIMNEGMLCAEERGFAPILTIHDETVTEVPATKVDRVEELCDALCTLSPWVEGLPIVAEGWQGRRFTK